MAHRDTTAAGYAEHWTSVVMAGVRVGEGVGWDVDDERGGEGSGEWD